MTQISNLGSFMKRATKYQFSSPLYQGGNPLAS